MSYEVPDSVRFTYAREAPTPLNWYSEADYRGCLVRWDAPCDEADIEGYVIFRTAERLDDDCAWDLLEGHHDDIAERIDVSRPITALIDDQIHDRNRYLVMARTHDGDYLVPGRAKAEMLTPEHDLDALQPFAWWSNPSGDRQRGRQPCRLDYLTIRPESFSAFEWDYPDEIEGLTHYEFIISRQPISPHTGDEHDISEFRAVLAGEHGGRHELEAWVNTVVDNITDPGSYWYFALLACDDHGCRTQIDMRHRDELRKGQPYRNLRETSRSGRGTGLDRMEAAWEAWQRARDGEDELDDELDTPDALDSLDEPALADEPEPTGSARLELRDTTPTPAGPVEPAGSARLELRDATPAGPMEPAGSAGLELRDEAPDADIPSYSAPSSSPPPYAPPSDASSEPDDAATSRASSVPEYGVPEYGVPARSRAVPDYAPPPRADSVPDDAAALQTPAEPGDTTGDRDRLDTPVLRDDTTAVFDVAPPETDADELAGSAALELRESPRDAAPPTPPALPEPWAGITAETPLDAASYADDAGLCGLRLTWSSHTDGRRVVALRATAPIEDEARLGDLLSGASPVDDDVDRIEFVAPSGHVMLLDLGCHDRVWYLVATLDDDGRIEPVDGLHGRPLFRVPDRSGTVVWHCAGEPMRDRRVHVPGIERVERREEPLGLELGSHDMAAPTHIELYRLDADVDWLSPSPADIAGFHALQRGEDHPIGARVRIPAGMTRVRDDLSPPGRWSVAAVVVDARDNRLSVPVFRVGAAESRDWPRLSELVPGTTGARAVPELDARVDLSTGETEAVPRVARPESDFIERLPSDPNLPRIEMPRTSDLGMPTDATPSEPISGVGTRALTSNDAPTGAQPIEAVDERDRRDDPSLDATGPEPLSPVDPRDDAGESGDAIVDIDALDVVDRLDATGPEPMATIGAEEDDDEFGDALDALDALDATGPEPLATVGDEEQAATAHLVDDDIPADVVDQLTADAALRADADERIEPSPARASDDDDSQGTDFHVAPAPEHAAAHAPIDVLGRGDATDERLDAAGDEPVADLEGAPADETRLDVLGPEPVAFGDEEAHGLFIGDEDEDGLDATGPEPLDALDAANRVDTPAHRDAHDHADALLESAVDDDAPVDRAADAASSAHGDGVDALDADDGQSLDALDALDGEPATTHPLDHSAPDAALIESVARDDDPLGLDRHATPARPLDAASAPVAALDGHLVDDNASASDDTVGDELDAARLESAEVDQLDHPSPEPVATLALDDDDARDATERIGTVEPPDEVHVRLETPDVGSSAGSSIAAVGDLERFDDSTGPEPLATIGAEEDDDDELGDALDALDALDATGPEPLATVGDEEQAATAHLVDDDIPADVVDQLTADAALRADADERIEPSPARASDDDDDSLGTDFHVAPAPEHAAAHAPIDVLGRGEATDERLDAAGDEPVADLEGAPADETRLDALGPEPVAHGDEATTPAAPVDAADDGGRRRWPTAPAPWQRISQTPWFSRLELDVRDGDEVRLVLIEAPVEATLDAPDRELPEGARVFEVTGRLVLDNVTERRAHVAVFRRAPGASAWTSCAVRVVDPPWTAAQTWAPLLDAGAAHRVDEAVASCVAAARRELRADPPQPDRARAELERAELVGRSQARVQAFARAHGITLSSSNPTMTSPRTDA